MGTDPQSEGRLLRHAKWLWRSLTSNFSFLINIHQELKQNPDAIFSISNLCFAHSILRWFWRFSAGNQVGRFDTEIIRSFGSLQHAFSIGCSESARDRQLTTRQGFKVHPTWNSRSGTGKTGTNFNMYFVSDAHTCGNFPHMFKLPDLCSLQTCVCNCWYNFLGTWHCYTLPFAEAIWWLLPLGWRWLSVASASGR